MITEPEAAALYTLQSMKEKGLNVSFMICLYCELQPLTIPRMVMLVIIICDAGGGTADLISYEIVSHSPFHVKALTTPSGQSTSLR